MESIRQHSAGRCFVGWTQRGIWLGRQGTSDCRCRRRPLPHPRIKARLVAILSADTDPLTGHTIVNETTWADRYRDSDRNTTKVRYNQTREWHFVDIEITTPDINAACFGTPSLPTGTPASAGPARDCVVGKINQFIVELKSPVTSPEERLLALKFLLHFVGDMHQPLHASDDHDAGGNQKNVTAIIKRTNAAR